MIGLPHPAWLHNTSAQQIMNIESANGPMLVVDDDETSDFVFFHQFGCFCGKTVSADRDGVRRHDIGDAEHSYIRVTVDCPAQVTVGKKAFQLPIGSDDSCHAELFSAHFC